MSNKQHKKLFDVLWGLLYFGSLNRNFLEKKSPINCIQASIELFRFPDSSILAFDAIYDEKLVSNQLAVGPKKNCVDIYSLLNNI